MVVDEISMVRNDSAACGQAGLLPGFAGRSESALQYRFHPATPTWRH